MTQLYSVRYRFYAYSLGQWVTRDPIEYLGGATSLYSYVTGQPIQFVDPLGLILVAIDGTGSREFAAECGAKYMQGNCQSHVRRFFLQYSGTEKEYFHGPPGDARHLKGAIASAAAKEIENNAYAWVCRMWCNKKSKSGERKAIDIVGHSRGGYIAMQLARRLQTHGCNCKDGTCRPVMVRFVGLYDPVDMAPDYAEHEQADQLSRNVQRWAIAIASPPVASDGTVGDQSRGAWRRPPLTGPRAERLLPKGAVRRFTGTHSGLGGAPWMGDQPGGHSAANDRAQAIAVDRWIRSRAAQLGVPIRSLTDADYGYPVPK